MAVAAEPAPALEPDLETARRLARDANVVPVSLRFVDDCETPVSAFVEGNDQTGYLVAHRATTLAMSFASSARRMSFSPSLASALLTSSLIRRETSKCSGAMSSSTN